MTNLYVGFHKYKLQWKKKYGNKNFILKDTEKTQQPIICGLFWILTFEISNDLYETIITE